MMNPPPTTILVHAVRVHVPGGGVEIITREADTNPNSLVDEPGIHIVQDDNHQPTSDPITTSKNCRFHVGMLFLGFCLFLFLSLSMLAMWSDLGRYGGAAPPGKWICNSVRESDNSTDISGCRLVIWSASDDFGCRWCLTTYIIGVLVGFCGLIMTAALQGLSLGDYRRAKDVRSVYGRKVLAHRISLLGSVVVFLAMLMWAMGCNRDDVLGIPTGSLSDGVPVSSLTVIYYAVLVCTVLQTFYNYCKLRRKCRRRPEANNEPATPEPQRSTRLPPRSLYRQATYNVSAYPLPPVSELRSRHHRSSQLNSIQEESDEGEHAATTTTTRERNMDRENALTDALELVVL